MMTIRIEGDPEIKGMTIGPIMVATTITHVRDHTVMVHQDGGQTMGREIIHVTVVTIVQTHPMADKALEVVPRMIIVIIRTDQTAGTMGDSTPEVTVMIENQTGIQEIILANPIITRDLMTNTGTKIKIRDLKISTKTGIKIITVKIHVNQMWLMVNMSGMNV